MQRGATIEPSKEFENLKVPLEIGKLPIDNTIIDYVNCSGAVSDNGRKKQEVLSSLYGGCSMRLLKLNSRTLMVVVRFVTEY